MSVVYLSLGSNMGDREGILGLAIEEIGKRIGNVTKVSNKYETEPWGFISENKFLNMALEVKTELSPYEISERVHKIEDDLGRTLPHPKMHLREFVIFPLCEIAPNAIHPLLRSSIEDIKNNLTN